VVEVHNLFPDPTGTIIDTRVFFSFSICQAMKSKKVTIGCLYNVLLGLISEEGTYLSEIRCVCNRAGKYFLLCALGARFIRDQKVEKCLGLAIAKFDDRVWKTPSN
jgi:hypothetical protein